ncbi:uncharacterized protein [Coffea arabica]|uniref:UBN2_2 domain-containing protein n=1 Tax=Coffea arabica TaxID=13443 RepID=A0A6P6XBF5_COFAR|nr:uncharacterized protein LOC113740891 [Coffea arabica]
MEGQDSSDLRCRDLDLALHENEPPIPMDSSLSNEKAAYERWERSNHLNLKLIKSHNNQSIKGSIPDCDPVKAYMKAIDEQFVSSDKVLASSLMKKFARMTFDKSGSVREHIMEMKDIAAKLKSLKVEISVSFLVHFILNSLPLKYTLFKISYNTHKEEWSINELLIDTNSVDDEIRDNKFRIDGDCYRFGNG